MEKRNLHDLEVQNLLHENEELRQEISSYVHFTSFESKTSIYRNLVLSIAILFPWCIIVFLSPWTRTTCPRVLQTSDGCPAKLFYSECMAHRSPCLAYLDDTLLIPNQVLLKILLMITKPSLLLVATLNIHQNIQPSHPMSLTDSGILYIQVCDSLGGNIIT